MTYKSHHKHLPVMFNYPFVPSLQEDTKPKPVEPTDAATLIAEALKRKFAHRYRSDSECDDKFNLPAPENKTHVETALVREITQKMISGLFCFSAIVIMCHFFFSLDSIC